jgi:hypothetical protein
VYFLLKIYGIQQNLNALNSKNHKRSTMKNFMIVLSLVISGGTLSAQNVFLVEHFNYPANDELRQHGWTSHSAATTNPLKVSPSGLAWSQTNYLGSGIGNAASVDNTGSDENYPISTLALDSGVVYTSFLARVNGTVTSSGEGFFFHVGQYGNTTTPVFTSINSGFRGRTFKAPGSSADKFKFGLTFNAASVGANTTVAEYDTGATYLLVLKYEFFPGAMNDSVSLYIFADGDAIDIEPATPALGPFGSTASNAGDLDFFQLVALRQYNAAQNVTVDGIIVQDSWNLAPPLISPNLLSPPDNTTLVVAGAPTIPANITWTSAQNLAAPVAYEWQLALRSAGNFNNPALGLPSNNMGADTTLSLNFGQIDAALDGLGVATGDTVRGMWRVRAIGGTDTLFSSQTFDIDIVRGIIVSPIAGFQLVSPPNQTVLNIGPDPTTPVSIAWRATSAGTQSIAYEWQFALRAAGNFNNPALVLPSDNGGADTVLSLTHGAIDAALGSLGVAVGATVQGMWRVRAIAGTDTAFSNNTFDIDIVRDPIVRPIDGFDLLSPPDQTVLSVGPNAAGNATISWQATTAGTQSVSYEWHAILPGGSFTNPLVSISAGTDTTLVLPLTAIDSLLNSLGINPGDTVALDWTVEAAAGTDSRLANQDWRITLIRESNVSVAEFGNPLSEMRLFPNPAGDAVSLQMAQGLSGRVFIQLVDPSGRIVLEKQEVIAAGQPIHLNLNPFPQGIYSMQVSHGQHVQKSKLIIQK